LSSALWQEDTKDLTYDSTAQMVPVPRIFYTVYLAPGALELLPQKIIHVLLLAFLQKFHLSRNPVQAPEPNAR